VLTKTNKNISLQLLYYREVKFDIKYIWFILSSAVPISIFAAGVSGFKNEINSAVKMFM
jgi:hypothetical protein